MEDGGCNECTGPHKSQCTAATCAAGYSVGSFGNGSCCRAIVEERTDDGCSCVAGHYRDIKFTMQCQPCPEGTIVRDDGLGCGCAPGWYDFFPLEGNQTTSFNKPIACHEQQLSELMLATIPNEGCQRCGGCLNCGSARVTQTRPGYVRILGDSTGARINVLRCKYPRGCFSKTYVDPEVVGCKTCAEPTLDLTVGCYQHYSGHFCATCIDGYEMKQIEAVDLKEPKRPSFECIPCESVATQSGLAFLMMVVLATPVVVLRKRITIFIEQSIQRNQARIAAFRAVVRSSWQPIRIVIT